MKLSIQKILLFYDKNLKSKWNNTYREYNASYFMAGSLFAFSLLILSIAFYMTPAFAIEFQVVFFCGAGGVLKEDCIKDKQRIEDITKLPVKMFFPSGKWSPSELKKYTDEDFMHHKKWMQKKLQENRNVHFAFVASSHGWIPFSKLSQQFGDNNLTPKSYDVILNQPAGKLANGFIPNKFPHQKFSFDDLSIQPRYVVNLRSSDLATGDRFDEPNIIFSKNYFEIRYGPLTDLKEYQEFSSPRKKHGEATGAGLKNEVPALIKIFSNVKNEISASKEINHVLSEGQKTRQHFQTLRPAPPTFKLPKKLKNQGGVPINIDSSNFRGDDKTDSAKKLKVRSKSFGESALTSIESGCQNPANCYAPPSYNSVILPPKNPPGGGSGWPLISLPNISQKTQLRESFLTPEKIRGIYINPQLKEEDSDLRLSTSTRDMVLKSRESDNSLSWEIHDK